MQRLQQWIDVFNADERTCETLRSFAARIEPHIDAVIGTFYDAILKTDSARLFKDADAIAHARKAQRTHWLDHVLSGRFDASYLARARAIGEAHYRAGVDLMVYASGYGLLHGELNALIDTLYPDNLEQRQDVIEAVRKAVYLDMSLAMSVYHEAFVKGIQEMSNELNFSLARAGEYRDNETGRHLMRMGRMCSALALAIGKGPDWARMIEIASPLHDVGKIGIVDKILLKPGALDSGELEIMRRHAAIGGDIIPANPVDVISMARAIALTHHERFDGAGYPEGLSGQDIPIEGRIAAICDVYDALVSRRPYKNPWPKDKAASHIAGNKGTHFDPELVEAFLAILPEIDAIQEHFAETGTENAA